MDAVEELNSILRMSTYNSAKALRLPNYGLQPGCTADFVVLDAPNPSAAIVGKAEKRVVVKNGRVMATNQTINQLYNGSLAANLLKNV